MFPLLLRGQRFGVRELHPRSAELPDSRRTRKNQTGGGFRGPVTDITAQQRLLNYTAGPNFRTPKGMRRNSHRTADREIFEAQAAILKVLAHPNRIYLFELLGHGEKSLSSLQMALGITKQNLSQHLAILKRVGVVTTRRKGKQVYASLTFPQITHVAHLIRRVLREQVRRRQRLAA